MEGEAQEYACTATCRPRHITVDCATDLSTFAASKPTDPGDPDENLYSPFLWGEVNLDREFQVEGWMVFDVPKGLVLGSLWWDEVDSIIADFIEYRRRRA